MGRKYASNVRRENTREKKGLQSMKGEDLWVDVGIDWKTMSGRIRTNWRQKRKLEEEAWRVKGSISTLVPYRSIID